jgi:CRP-like cAMP-binding protein
MAKSLDIIKVELKKNALLCKEGDQDNDLYLIESGVLMVCVLKGTQVSPLANLKAGEFLGELSFFDEHPRSAYVFALEDSILSKIPAQAAMEFFPRWTITLARYMTKRIRSLDEYIRQKGLKKHSSNKLPTLTPQEQGQFYRLIKNAKGEGV